MFSLAVGHSSCVYNLFQQHADLVDILRYRTSIRSRRNQEKRLDSGFRSSQKNMSISIRDRSISTSTSIDLGLLWPKKNRYLFFFQSRRGYVPGYITEVREQQELVGVTRRHRFWRPLKILDLDLAESPKKSRWREAIQSRCITTLVFRPLFSVFCQSSLPETKQFPPHALFPVSGRHLCGNSYSSRKPVLLLNCCDSCLSDESLILMLMCFQQ